MAEPKYDYISNVQEAINMAVAKKRVVRFLSEKSNEQLKKEIVDIKGCQLRKPNKDAHEIAVIPPSVDADTFDFDEVDTSAVLWLPKGGIH